MSEWYYSKNNQQQGPIDRQALIEKLSVGDIGKDDLVWSAGMADWRAVSEVDDFASFVAGKKFSMIGASEEPVRETGFRADVAGEKQVMPPRYTWQSIVAVLIGAILVFAACIPIVLPFAIVALVYSTKVEARFKADDPVGAIEASKITKVWLIVSYLLAGIHVLALFGIFGLGVFLFR